MRLPVLCFLAVLPNPIPAQSLAPYGSGCGARGTLLSAYGSPAPSGIVELELSAARPSTLHALVVGTSSTSWSGGSLPWPFPPAFGFAPGCALLASPDLVVPLPTAADGRARLGVLLPAAIASLPVYAQALAPVAAEPGYATRGIAITIGAGAPAAVRGTVRARANGAPVGSARVTVFTPGLGAFHEARTDAAGAFALPVVARGLYRFGVAARDFEYVEVDLAVGAGPVVRDMQLDPEAHPGGFAIIGNTLPETLDATDIAILLPDGRILYCHDTLDPIVFDPVTSQKTLPASSNLEQGCMNVTLLEDGSAILIGGQDSGNFRDATRMVKTWSAANGWRRIADLLHTRGRWYPGLARLADGDLLVIGGGQRPDASRTNTCEIFDQLAGAWRFVAPVAQPVEFPPCALLHGGSVLKTWGGCELYDPRSTTWSATGQLVAGNRGYPGHSDHSLVVLTDRRALAVGIRTSLAGPQAAMVESYDPQSGQWSARSSPVLKREQCEVVYLPDGRVLVAGGDVANQATTVPQLYGIVKWCDLYDPAADRWRRVADLLQFREYHAVTLLVPDGRVVTTGGTNIKFRNPPLSADIEAFSPPYLFRGVRPRIANLSATVLRRGDPLAFDVFPGTRLTKVVLLGTGAHTHWVDAGVMRRLELDVAQSGTRVSLTLPADPNELPAGHYLLFAMVDDIPSVARIVRVQR
jgi:hypothetical protein